jgi:osmotically inducible lipoprotein OsmB
MNYLLNRTCIAITVMALGACSGMTQREKDTAVGAGVGAAAGAVLGGGVMGTVGGAVVGGAIGHETSDDKKK